MRNVLIAAAVLALAGCATTSEDLGGDVKSLTDAGVTSFESTDKVAPDGSYVKTVRAASGKNYNDFSLELEIVPEGETVMVRKLKVRAGGVNASEGQRIAAEAIVKIREQITKQNIRTIEELLPVVQQVILGIVTGGASVVPGAALGAAASSPPPAQ